MSGIKEILLPQRAGDGLQIPLPGFGPRPPSGYPVDPGFKVHGTSEDAAHAIKDKAKSLEHLSYEQVVAAGAWGLTPDECAELLQEDPNDIRPRFTALKKATDERPARILNTKRRRLSKRGNPQTVCVAREFYDAAMALDNEAAKS